LLIENKVRTTTPHNNALHHNTITHLLLDLLHRFELFYGKQQTSRRNEIRDIESDFKAADSEIEK
jgi:hypothetical protein